MEERSLRQCKGDWRPNGEKEPGREREREREKGMLHERAGRTEWWVRRRATWRGAWARTREEEGRLVIKGATRGAAAAWKKVSLPSGSSVRRGAVSRMHVEPSIFRVPVT